MIVFQLRQMMAEKKVNIRELSKRTDISEVSISRLYHGADMVRFDTLNKICEALRCDLNDILKYKPDPPPKPEMYGVVEGKN